MSAPLISIVIPTYNHAHFLRAALDSVFAQTLVDWEAIVVNNFSTDDTIDVVASYADPRIRCVNFANRGVIAASRNHGIAATSAPYVAFLDSDDVWYPQKLEKCLAQLQKGFDMVCHAETWVGPGLQRRDVMYGPAARATYESLLFEGNCISTSAVIVKREFLERAGCFSEEAGYVTAEDYDLWLHLARVGTRIGFLNEVLGEYVIHGGNQSHAVLRNMEAVMAVVQRHLQDRASEHRNRASTWRIRRRLALVYYGGARGLQENGQFHKAWRYFFKAIALYPFVPKFHLAMLLNTIRCK